MTRRCSRWPRWPSLGRGLRHPDPGPPEHHGPSKVPFDLLNPHPPTTTTTTQPKPSSLVPVKVFFLTPTNTLTAVQRFVAAPAPLTAVLGLLLDGPEQPGPARGSPPPSRAT